MSSSSPPLRFNCRSVGRTGERILIFLHGSFGSREDWSASAEFFAHDFYCLLADIPGHGSNTGFDITRRISFKEVVGALGAFIAESCPRPPVVIGFGLGARLALSLAVKHPKALSGVVAESCHPGIRDRHERLKRQARDADLAKRILSGGFEAFLDEWYALPVFRSLQDHPEKLAQYKQERLERTSPDWAAKVLVELGPGNQPSLWARIPALTVPALFLSGALDGKYTELMRQAAASSAMITHRVIAGSGHIPHLEQPRLFVETVSSFLAQTAFLPQTAARLTD